MEMDSHSRVKRGAMEEDRLSSLPDDLLHPILRDLPLKQAARTSALSRRWARLWLHALAASPVLDLTDREFARGQAPARAAATVGRCLRLHAEHRAPLHSFRAALVAAPLGDDGAFARDVLGWVAAAVARGAREVQVDLLEPPPPPPSQAGGANADHGSAAYQLVVPADLFEAGNSLERLALGGFSLRAVLPGAAGLAGLSSLSLTRAADVTGDAVRALLAACRSLESLSLTRCPHLTSLAVASDGLRRLELVGCRGLRELHVVAAPALESLAFHGPVHFRATSDEGYDYDVPLDLGDDEDTAMPALRDAHLCHVGFGEYEDPSAQDYENPLLYYVAHARVLTLCSVGLLQIYDETAYPDMPSLEELQLLMGSLGDRDMIHVATFFMFVHLPLLDRLFVRLPAGLPAHAGGAAALTTAVEDDGADEIVLEYEYPEIFMEWVLEQLTFVKVVNFRGTGRELRLLRFFLKRAPALERLVLVTVGDDDEEGGAPGGDEQLIKAIQGLVPALQQASPSEVLRVSVCRPCEDDSPNHAHTRFYHEE